MTTFTPAEPEDEPTNIQSLGGKARADKLSPARLKEIAAKAAAARWKFPKATHAGELKIGNVIIHCAVLEDGTRVLTQYDFLRAIGRSGKPAAGRGSADFDELKGVAIIGLRKS